MVDYHVVNDSERLTEEDICAYLAGGGYEAEAAAMTADALRFPGTYKYTADRHRFIVWSMPGRYWMAGDCAESEERIKALGAARRAGASLRRDAS